MPGVEGRNILVLGGAGLVGTAVCRQLIPHKPSLLEIAARRQSKASRTAELLAAEFPEMADRIVPVWGDVFLRAEWQGEGANARESALADRGKRRRLIRDILDPLDDDIARSSLLFQIIMGEAENLDGARAGIVVDCMNTATAISYQDIYGLAGDVSALAEADASHTNWAGDVERLLAALYVPQLVRHIQLLYWAMRDAGTQAYVKVGTSGTGGMGFNIPYTHGEEKPSRLLLSKAAVAGAQSLLTFLMARTPDAPPLVREIKPTALIGWHEISFGPVHRRGRELPLYDCPVEEAVSVEDPANIVAEGDFGRETGELLEGVYIDTGENGLFTADEFAAISTLGQMQLVTAEEVAQSVARELLGGTTGHDIIGALDASVLGPTYRGGYLRQSALGRLRQMEAEHGQAVAFEILGPPRLSKLLYEAYLLKSVGGTTDTIIGTDPEELAQVVAERVEKDTVLRRRILSIGIPILLTDSRRLLRGPLIKSGDAYHGWLDLTPSNMRTWQERFKAIRGTLADRLAGDTSSRHPHEFTASRESGAEPDALSIGEVVGWILLYEEGGQREKD